MTIWRSLGKMAGRIAHETEKKENWRTLGRTSARVSNAVVGLVGSAIEHNQQQTEHRQEIREAHITELRSNGLIPNEDTVEFRSDSSYQGGHPSMVQVVDGGMLMLSDTGVHWFRTPDALFIPYGSIQDVELANYNVSPIRAMLFTTQNTTNLQHLQNRIVLTCTAEGTKFEVMFELTRALTLFGNGAVAKEFINHIARHRHQFSSSQDLALPSSELEANALTAQTSVADELSKLGDLYTRGLLDEPEFRNAKSKLLL